MRKAEMRNANFKNRNPPASPPEGARADLSAAGPGMSPRVVAKRHNAFSGSIPGPSRLRSRLPHSAFRFACRLRAAGPGRPPPLFFDSIGAAFT